MTAADAAIAKVMGWPSNAVCRSAAGLIYSSWFPVNATQAVLFSGQNRSIVADKIPMSKALAEEYGLLSAVRSGLRNRTPYRQVK